MNEAAAEHVLRDLLRPGLRVAFCGTQAGEASALRRAYYAGQGNKFWKTLHQIRLTPICLVPESYSRLLDYGVGLTDVAKLTSGPDAALRKDHFDVAGFVKRIEHFAPKVIAFNGKRAASVTLGTPTRDLEYGAQGRLIGSSAVFVLPSTSGSASRWWNIEPWAEVAKVLGEQA